ncbi:MAG: cohesin domain-containing protein [bacterium]
MQIITKKISTIIIFVVAILLGLSCFFMTKSAEAQSSASVILSSSTPSVSVGGDVVVNVSVNVASGSIGGIAIDLNYDKSKLQYQSVDHFSGTNDFTEIFSEVVNQNNGIIHVEAGKQGGLLSGTGNIFAAHFKVLTIGSATFTASPIDGANQDGSVLLTANNLSVALAAIAQPTFVITYHSAGTGTGTVKNGNTTINNNDIITIVYGGNLTLTPSPDANSDFTGWSGDTTDGTLYNITANKSITATFTRKASAPLPDNIAPSNNNGTVAIGNSNTNKANLTTSAIAVYDFSKSEVVFNKIFGVADDSDKICINILIKNYGNTVINIKPTIKTDGGVDIKSLDLINDNWSACITSKTEGSKRLMISVNDILIKDQTVNFTLPVLAGANVVAPIVTSGEVKVTDSVSKVIPKQLLIVKGDVSILSNNDLLNRGEITDVDIIQISGTGDPGTTLRLYIHSPVLIQKDVVVGPDGKWIASLDTTLSPGDHRVEVAIVNSYGQESNTKLITKFNVAKSKNKTIIIAGISTLIFILLIIFFIIKRKKKIYDNYQDKEDQADNIGASSINDQQIYNEAIAKNELNDFPHTQQFPDQSLSQFHDNTNDLEDNSLMESENEPQTSQITDSQSGQEADTPIFTYPKRDIDPFADDDMSANDQNDSNSNTPINDVANENVDSIRREM